MSEVFFVIKVTILTFVLVLFLQIKIGTQTIDEKIHQGLQESSVLAPLQEVAKGGVLAIEQAYQKLVKQFDKKLSDKIEQTNAPGNRTLLPELKRFKKETKEKAAEVQDSVKKASQKFQDRLFSEDEY